MKDWRKEKRNTDDLKSSIKDEVKSLEKEIIEEIKKMNPRLEELDQNWIKHFTREYLDLKAAQEAEQEEKK